MLRIIAGKHRGRKIEQPPTDGTRPTVDRVKEAMFNMVDSLFQTHETSWQEVRALDLFAGSGALVLESLSRGASFGLMVEPGQTAFHTLLQNKEALKIGDEGQVWRKNALQVAHAQPSNFHLEPFNLVFLDPPYAFKELDQVIAGLFTNGWLAPHGFLVFELSAEAETPTHPKLSILKDRTFGRIKVVIAGV